jgi:hypothetical protein
MSEVQKSPLDDKPRQRHRLSNEHPMPPVVPRVPPPATPAPAPPIEVPALKPPPPPPTLLAAEWAREANWRRLAFAVRHGLSDEEPLGPLWRAGL